MRSKLRGCKKHYDTSTNSIQCLCCTIIIYNYYAAIRVRLRPSVRLSRENIQRSHVDDRLPTSGVTRAILRSKGQRSRSLGRKREHRLWCISSRKCTDNRHVARNFKGRSQSFIQAPFGGGEVHSLPPSHLYHFPQIRAAGLGVVWGTKLSRFIFTTNSAG